MKISVSLPEEDVAFVDAYAREHGDISRSAAMHEAVALLRREGLAKQYEAAYLEWEGSEDAALWDSAVGDGLTG